jgi:predicted esterase
VNEHHLTVQRTARYYTQGEPSGAEHIWIGLHGYGQSASVFLSYLATLEDERRLIVAPEALSRFYQDQGRGPVGASWMTREDREHEISDYVHYLDAMYREVAARVSSSARFYLLGFSQGAATAGRWIDRGVARFHGACFWAGTLPPELTPDQLHQGFAATRVALALGSRDSYLTSDWLETECRRMEPVAQGVRTFSFDGGHRLDRHILAAIATYFESRQ